MDGLKIYDVELTLTTDMLGTVCKNREIYTNYIESKRPPTAIGEKETETIDENAGWDGFHVNAAGELMVYDYFIKGFIKNAGNIIKDFPEIKIKNLRSKINNLVFVAPRQISLGKTKPDGVLERPIRAMTAQGPRVSLKKSDYVAAGTKIKFRLEVLNKNIISKKTLEAIFDYGKYMALGEWRNGGYGRVSYKLTEVE